LAMFPNARIIHCQRDWRATTLSLWMQSFKEEVQGYAYDLGDINAVMRDSGRLMQRWHDRYHASIRAVRYEDVVAKTSQVLADLAAWIGTSPDTEGHEKSAGIISSASLWQARQPVYPDSMQRWTNYVPYIPELSHAGG
jgi:sulfotransferase family protein